jgi:hypothetical protein
MLGFVRYVQHLETREQIGRLLARREKGKIATGTSL